MYDLLCCKNYPYKLTSQSSDVQVPCCPLPGGGLQLQHEALLLLPPQLHGLLVPQLRPRLEVEAVHVSLHRLHLLTQPRPPLLQCPSSKGVNETSRRFPQYPELVNVYLSASLMDSRVTGVTGSPHLAWMSAGNQALDLTNIVSIQNCYMP